MKVKDQCHFTGRYRNITHFICNLKYDVLKKIPIIFEIGSKYDFHLMIKHLTEKSKETILITHARIQKKYISFSVD